ncbi:MAG: ADP-forming succinate--CoA ligase subunit beta [Planctomycetota bacterium]
MKIHEYQAKGLLARYGVPVPHGHVADSVSQARSHAEALGGEVWVVKAQIHAGGRGKGGGVKVCRSLAEVEQAAKAILGMQLITHQTGPAGQQVRKVLIEEGCKIDRELYLGLVIDRHREAPVLMASARGGMDIEEVARDEPGAILFETVAPEAGLAEFQGRRLAERLGLPNASVTEFATLAVAFARAFVQEDCSLAEINPLILTGDGKLLALDAKVTFDDNAQFRHSAHAELRDLDEEDPMEIRASKHDLSYVNMDGNIGCMVNGAGLAMATMDIIKLHGGEPANFLDVGGSATRERVTEAFRIILSDPKVKSILVNIFGGIVRCDMIAEGVIEAVRDAGIEVPLVVRLEGNRVAEGKKLLSESGLNIVAADDLEDAAKKAVRTAGGVSA